MWLQRKYMSISIASMLLIALSASADIFVDDDNTTGPWDGTQAHPFRTVQDGLDAASVGSVIDVAEGLYAESIVVPSDVSVYGGWAGDWSVRDWNAHVTHIRFDQGPMFNLHAIELNSRCRFDGFHLTFLDVLNTATIHANGAEDLHIENIRILEVRAMVHYITPTSGSATGIYLESCGMSESGIVLRGIEVAHVSGGGGATGEFHTNPDGGDGYPGFGIVMQMCRNTTIEDIWIHGVRGGGGGNSDPRVYGAGGQGAEAYGIAMALCSDIDISGCLIEVVSGGTGGMGEGNSFECGQGGNAYGLAALAVQGLVMGDLTIRYVTGGSGGWSSGTGERRAQGGMGANGRALDVTAGEDFRLFNSLFYSIRGGNGGFGYSGGDAGNAMGMHVDTEDPDIRQVTLAYCFGGTGGDGEEGRSGNGGNAVGMDIQNSGAEAIAGAVVCFGWGGQPGQGIPRGISGTSTGIHATVEGGVSYVDVWGHDQNFSTCFPGPGSFSMDPLFAEKAGWQPFFLSCVTGQGIDSPCIDAVPQNPADAYPDGHATTRTDLLDDTVLLDMGYHFDSSQSPLPVTTPVVTATPTSPSVTETPTPQATGTPTPSPELGVRIEMPEMVHPGESFGVTGYLDNPGDVLPETPVFFILQIDDAYWFWNDWTLWMPPKAEGIDFERMTVPTGTTEIIVIPAFIWPDTGSDSRTGLRFYGAMLTPDASSILGSMVMIEWGYGPG